MPSWPIHIALANRLKEKYQLTDDFILGNVLPDATNGMVIKDISNVIRHSITHYNFEGVNHPPKNDTQKFLEVYQEKLDNPLIFGSYIHLLTDNYYNEYTVKHHITFLDGKRAAILKDGSMSNEITPYKLKQQDFMKFGNDLTRKRQLGEVIQFTDQTIHFSKDLVYQVTPQDLSLIVGKINSYFDKDVGKTQTYKMFEAEELKYLFDSCLEYLDAIIKHSMKNEKM